MECIRYIYGDIGEDMYAVSTEYKRQLKRPYILKTRLIGTIGDTAFTEADIIDGSFSVSNQCSESGEVKIGTVYTAELNCTFRKNIIDRNTWKGLVIEVSEALKLHGGEYESVPLGIFTIDDATHEADGVSVTAYDNMLLFEKAFSVDTTYGYPYDLLLSACTACGVTLGMTAEQIEAFPNGNLNMVLYTENDIETWRDYVSWIAQSLCAFATIDRQGHLVLRSYGNTVAEEFDNTLRSAESEFSDFETEYSGIAYTDVETGKYIYYGTEEDTKLVYNLGANPFLQYGTKSAKKLFCMNILNRLRAIKYVPFSTRLLNGPVFDLGDVISFTGGLADDDKVSCIMFYEYSFRNRYSIEGFGKNPALMNARSKVDKDLRGILNNQTKRETRYYTFVNTGDIAIVSGNTVPIIDIRFASTDATYVIFQAEVLLGTEGSGQTYTIGKAIYTINEVEDTFYYPEETWIDGKHVLHLLYFLDIEANTANHIVVSLNAIGGNVRIGTGQIKASIYGQGLAAAGEDWDGFLNFEDNLGGYDADISGITDIGGMSGTVAISQVTPHTRALSDNVEAVDIEGIGVAGISDILQINKDSLTNLTWGEVGAYTWGQISDGFMW